MTSHSFKIYARGYMTEMGKLTNHKDQVSATSIKCLVSRVENILKSEMVSTKTNTNVYFAKSVRTAAKKTKLTTNQQLKIIFYVGDSPHVLQFKNKKLKTIKNY